MHPFPPMGCSLKNAHLGKKFSFYGEPRAHWVFLTGRKKPFNDKCYKPNALRAISAVVWRTVALSNSIASWGRQLITYRLHRRSGPSSLWRVDGCPWISTWGVPSQQQVRPPHYTQIKPKLIIARKALCSTTLTYPIQLCACPFGPLPPFLHIKLLFIFQRPVLPHCILTSGITLPFSILTYRTASPSKLLRLLRTAVVCW